MAAGRGVDTWIAARLAEARPAFEQSDPALHHESLAAYEQALREMVAPWLRPTRPYVGATLDEARAHAERVGDRLCVHGVRPEGHRASWQGDRVHVQVGDQGRIVRASRDRAPWSPRTRP